MRVLRKTSLLISVAFVIGIFSFGVNAFADETSCDAKAICIWANEHCETNYDLEPYECSSALSTNECEAFNCSIYEVNICNSFVDEPSCIGDEHCIWDGSHNSCGLSQTNFCYGTMYPDELSYPTWCAIEDSNPLPVETDFAIHFGDGDVSSLMSNLGLAMTGIFAFMVDGAVIWLTLVAALLIIYTFRKFVFMKSASSSFSKKDKAGIMANVNRQKGLRHLAIKQRSNRRQNIRRRRRKK